jgi:hypothetical protein
MQLRKKMWKWRTPLSSLTAAQSSRQQQPASRRLQLHLLQRRLLQKLRRLKASRQLLLRLLTAAAQMPSRQLQLQVQEQVVSAQL